MLFTHFYLMQGKNRSLTCMSQQAEEILALDLQLFCQKFDRKKKNTCYVKETASYVLS